jgi:hypothetical protein
MAENDIHVYHMNYDKFLQSYMIYFKYRFFSENELKFDNVFADISKLGAYILFRLKGTIYVGSNTN